MAKQRVPTRAEIEAAHEKRFAYMSLLKTRFVIPHLMAVYQQFDGDLLMALVLGEIAIRNMQGVFEVRPEEPYVVLDRAAERKMVESQFSSERLRPANTLSLSTTTGIPRETVRRKLDKLESLGWIERKENGHLYVTEKVGRDLRDFDRTETVRFGSALGALLTILHETEDANARR